MLCRDPGQSRGKDELTVRDLDFSTRAEPERPLTRGLGQRVVDMPNCYLPHESHGSPEAGALLEEHESAASKTVVSTAGAFDFVRRLIGMERMAQTKIVGSHDSLLLRKCVLALQVS